MTTHTVQAERCPECGETNHVRFHGTDRSRLEVGTVYECTDCEERWTLYPGDCRIREHLAQLLAELTIEQRDLIHERHRDDNGHELPCYHALSTDDAAMYDIAAALLWSWSQEGTSIGIMEASIALDSYLVDDDETAPAAVPVRPRELNHCTSATSWAVTSRAHGGQLEIEYFDTRPQTPDVGGAVENWPTWYQVWYLAAEADPAPLRVTDKTMIMQIAAGGGPRNDLERSLVYCPRCQCNRSGYAYTPNSRTEACTDYDCLCHRDKP